MNIKKVILFFNILGVLFLLFAQMGKSIVEYAAVIGWIGAFVSFLVSIVILSFKLGSERGLDH